MLEGKKNRRRERRSKSARRARLKDDLLPTRFERPLVIHPRSVEQDPIHWASAVSLTTLVSVTVAVETFRSVFVCVAVDTQTEVRVLTWVRVLSLTTVVSQILVKVTGTSTLECERKEKDRKSDTPSLFFLDPKSRETTHVLMAVSVLISVLTSVAVSSLVAVSVLNSEDEKGKDESQLEVVASSRGVFPPDRGSDDRKRT